MSYEHYKKPEGWEMISSKQDQGNGNFLTQNLKNDYSFDRWILGEEKSWELSQEEVMLSAQDCSIDWRITLQKLWKMSPEGGLCYILGCQN